MLKSDKDMIKNHFRTRLLQRYGIKSDNADKLQDEFLKRLSFVNVDKFKTRLIKQYQDRQKSLYITSYQGKRVKFVFNSKYSICKTVL